MRGPCPVRIPRDHRYLVLPWRLGFKADGIAMCQPSQPPDTAEPPGFAIGLRTNPHRGEHVPGFVRWNADPVVLDFQHPLVPVQPNLDLSLRLPDQTNRNRPIKRVG